MAWVASGEKARRTHKMLRLIGQLLKNTEMTQHQYQKDTVFLGIPKQNATVSGRICFEMTHQVTKTRCQLI
jgi:hypothetical protein